ncbi:MAG: ABC-2 type transport system ATP-binding protein [Planctomycetota bacterium]|jgi:ABC-2 type transport system ATP-binding protein
MPVLEICSLTKRYGRVLALDNINLTVEPGQVYGLLGTNGSGKTTTMACALGLMRPTSGDVRVLGVPASQIHRTHGRVAAMFDAATLAPGLSVRENLGYARRLLGHTGGRGVNDVLELVGIADLAKQRAGALSLGQSRRLSISRILLGQPELVVLDEPLSGLDTIGVLEVLNLFRQLQSEGVTLLLSSHRMHEMERVVTHVGILKSGKLIHESSLDELLGLARGRVRIQTDDDERAREVLNEMDSVVSVNTIQSRAGVQELIVELGAIDRGTLNRTLVEAGCNPTALVPEGDSLHEVFENLVQPELNSIEQLSA